MKSMISPNECKLTEVEAHDTMRLSARSIRYGSYTEAAATRALIMVGVTIFCGLSVLVAFAILRS